MRYAVRKTITALGTFFGAIIVVFVAMRIAPGNPVYFLMGTNTTPQAVQAATNQLGLNLPLYEQFLIWLRSLFTLHLGHSFLSGQPIGPLIVQSLTRSIALVGFGLCLAIPTGLFTGVLAATYSRVKVLDNTLNGIATVLGAIPSFWQGYVVILIFAVYLRWLPASGVGGINYLVLPGIVLFGFSVPEVHRTIRGSMIDELAKPYCIAAKAKGASKFRVVTNHALRNALIPVVTVIGTEFGTLLAVAIGVEYIFAYPGIGLLILNGILMKDYLVAQDGIAVVTAIIIASNAIADIFVLRLNRRAEF